MTRIENKQIFINKDGKEVQHSITQVKPFLRYNLTDCLYSVLKPVSSQINKYLSVQLTEVPPINDPRSYSPEFTAAEMREIEGLVEKGTWKFVLKEDIPPNANILNGRFVLAIKDKDSHKQLFKAWFVVQGHRDKDKDILIHEISTVTQSSTRHLVTVALIF